MPSTYTALALSFGAQYGSLIFQFLTTVVVSRLLLPEEVGIYSLGASLLVIGHALRDFGTGQYVIQEKELTDDRIRAAFALTLGVAWVLATFILLIALPVGQFYEQPGVTEVLIVLSLNFFLLPFGTITAAYLVRHMNFRATIYSRLGAAAVSGVVTIACAFYGLSYMSMAWGGLAATFTTIGVMIHFRPKELPTWPGLKEIPHVLSFGTKLSVINILRQISTALPELIAGKTLGVHFVGIYSRARGTSQLFGHVVLSGLAPVATAVFAKKSRNSQDLHEPYVKGMRYITIIAWPFFGGMGLLAEELVLTLFGENWLETVPLIQIICVTACFYQLSSLAEQTFTATGNIDSLFRFNMRILPLRLVFLSGAAFVSLVSIVVTDMLLTILRLVFLYRNIKKITGITLSDYKLMIFQAAIACAVTVAGGWVGKNLAIQITPDIPLFTLLSGFIVGASCWLTYVHWSRHPLGVEIVQVLRTQYQARFSK